MELNWNDHREQLNAQLKWQRVRNDFYGNICYEQKNCAARERAIAGGHISGSTDSMTRYTNKHDERTAEVMDAHQFYNRVVIPLDQKIKQAYRDVDAVAHIAALIEANDVVLQMLDMTNLALDNDEFIEITKSLAASALGSRTSEKKAAAARANGAKGGRPRMQVIRTFNTALGGYEYRATGNEKVVNLQEKSSGSSKWRTMRTVSRETWTDTEMKDLTISQFARECNE